MVAALAAGQVSESVGRLICLWTDKLPEKYRDEADELLLAAAAAAGWGWRTWRRCSRRCTSGPAADLPDEDPDREFADRAREAGHHVRRRRA